MNPIRQYLSRYAEPEASFASDLAQRLRTRGLGDRAFETPGYRGAFVVPILDEPPEFLDGYREALAAADRLGQRMLGVVVVNARESVIAERALSNQVTMEALRASARSATALKSVVSSTARAWLLGFDSFDLVLIDRSSPGRRLPDKQGVGLARKIGSDLVVGLLEQGSLRTPTLVNLDADTELPRDYFLRTNFLRDSAAPGVNAGDQPAALVSAFEHVASGDAAVDAHTQRYEAGMRYVTLGLRAAGSPYTFHPIGSLLSVNLNAYVAVRGFPRRAAGEDFYLLCKLAKVGPICSLVGPRVRIRSRPSDRAPFGTGPHVARRLTHAESLEVYHPRSFRALAVWLAWLREARPDSELASAQLSSLADAWALGEEERAALEAYRDSSGLSHTFEDLRRHHRNSEALQRALETWFDRFRTMRLLHHLRQQVLPDPTWDEALTEAWFLPDSLRAALATGKPAAYGALRCYEELCQWADARPALI